MSAAPDGATIAVWVQPRSSRATVEGVADGRVRVRVTAPPVDDRANVEVCRLLARVLGVAPSSVLVTRGRTARRKVVSVRGVTVDDVLQRLGI